MRNNRLLLALAAFLAAAEPCSAGKGEDAFNFLLLDAGARPVAVGGAYTALATDANALLYNPAGLGLVRRHEATFMHNEYVQGLKQEYMALALKQGFGLSLNYLSFGDIPRTTISKPEGTGSNFTISDMAASAGYGRRVRPDLSLGLGVKLIRETIDDVKAQGTAADLGALYDAPWARGLSLGLALQNLGPGVRFQSQREKLPMNTRLGAAYAFKLWDNDDVISVDFSKTRGEGLLISAGAETVIKKTVSLRMGFNARNDADIGLTAGFGWRIKNASIDYAVVPFGDLDIAHRMSVSLRWGRDKHQTQEEADAEEYLARVARAESHLIAKRLEKARAELALILPLLKEKDPRKVRYFEMSARALRLAKDVSGAKSAYIQGLGLATSLGLRDRAVAQAFLGLGQCLEEEGNKTYAVRVYEKGLAIDPPDDILEELEKALSRMTGRPLKKKTEDGEQPAEEGEKKEGEGEKKEEEGAAPAEEGEKKAAEGEKALDEEAQKKADEAREKPLDDEAQRKADEEAERKADEERERKLKLEAEKKE